MGMERRQHDRTMRIGLFYPHTHAPHMRSRRIKAHVPDVFDLDVHRKLAITCERGGLDFCFTLDNWGVWLGDDDGQNRQQALWGPLLAAVLFAATRHIGFITTIHTSIFHPVHLARLGGNLDTLSQGRWGMNL